MNVRPRITVVIPTRERCDTLLWALKTCVTQDYDDFEILVSDNASADQTRQVVGSYDDPRIRYINPGRRLGMSEHWEFALDHVTEGNVCVIGDDDGLLPGAVEEIAAIIGPSGLPLVWPVQQYFWPSYPERALANSVVIPLRQPSRVREVSSAGSVAAVQKNSSLYSQLPSPYFGVVPVSALTAVRAKSGPVFHSITPDIYAGFAVAAVCPTYLRSDRAYTLAGQSAHSNGASQLSGRGNSDASSPAAKYDRENTTPFHRDLTFAPSIPIVVTEAAMQARDHVGLDVQIDFAAMIASTLRDSLYVLNPAVRPAVNAALWEIARSHDLCELLERELRHAQRRSRPRLAREAILSLTARHPLLACDPTVVTNVFEAAQLVTVSRPRFQSPYVGRVRRFGARISKIRRIFQAAVARARPA